MPAAFLNSYSSRTFLVCDPHAGGDLMVCIVTCFWHLGPTLDTNRPLNETNVLLDEALK